MTRSGKKLVATAILTIFSGCKPTDGSVDKSTAPALPTGASNTTNNQVGNAAGTGPLLGGAPLMNTADFAPTPGFNLTVLTQREVLQDIQSDSFLYANKPDRVPPHPCTLLLDSIPVQATRSSLVLAGTYDTTACANQGANATASARFTSMTVKVRAIFTCSDGDLSSFAGKTAKDTKHLAMLKVCRAGASSAEMVSSYQYVDTRGTSESSTAITFSGTSDLKPCPVSSASVDNSCTFIEKKSTMSSGSNGVTKSETLKKYTVQKLTQNMTSPANIWYTSGAMGISYNNWKGTLNYSGPTVPPTYALTATGSAAPVRGTLNVSASLNLSGAEAAAPIPSQVLASFMRRFP